MDTRVIYNLKTGAVTAAPNEVPRLVWNNRADKWEIIFTGRRPDPAVGSWRASVALDHLSDADNTLARFDSVTAAFGEAVNGKAGGVPMFLAVYGLGDGGETLEYLEIPVLGVPAVDPPGGDKPAKPRPAV